MTTLTDTLARCALTVYRVHETIEGGRDSIRELRERMDCSHRTIAATKLRLHADTQLQADLGVALIGRPD